LLIGCLVNWLIGQLVNWLIGEPFYCQSATAGQAAFCPLPTCFLIDWCLAVFLEFGIWNLELGI